MSQWVEYRDYQRDCIQDARQWLTTAQPGERRLYSAPTGSGKSFIINALLDSTPGAAVVTPSLEIIQGMLEKRGYRSPRHTAIRRAGETQRIFTPQRLLNRLFAAPDEFSCLILDEAHHSTSRSWRDLHALAGLPPCIGFTATPFRGSPRSTAEFISLWGEPKVVLTWEDAVSRGIITMPRCVTEPLVDDDEIRIVKGEFEITQIVSETRSRLSDAVRLFDLTTPTMAVLPSVDTCHVLRAMLDGAGLRACVVEGGTPHNERVAAFKKVLSCEAILLQVAVVGEGVDLPIRRLIDLCPMFSPVRWLQQFGRITRPGGESVYVCTNRNLLRHAYLLAGCIPPADYRASQLAFPNPGRTNGRVLGLEALGRLKPVSFPMKDGVHGTLYAVSTADEKETAQYACILHPLASDPVWAMRSNGRSNGVTVQWGKWQRCEPPTELLGFRSLPPNRLTEKQLAWWKRSAQAFGLDPNADVDAKTFQILPVLADLRLRFKCS